MVTRQSTRLPLIAVGAAVLLWSTSFAISGEVLDTASPAVVSVGRFVISLLVLVPIALRRPGLLSTLRHPRTMLLGFLGVALYYSLTNIALVLTLPGTVALTNAALPALTAALAFFILRERISPLALIGLVVATLGVVVVAGTDLTLDAGVAVSLMGLGSYASYTVLLRRGLISAGGGRSSSPTSHVDPLVLATATAVWGTGIMLPWLGLEMILHGAALPAEASGWGGLVFLGVVITAPTIVLFNYGAERLPAALTGILTAAIPGLGYLFSLILGEPVDIVTVSGGAIAVIGATIAVASARDSNTPGSRSGSRDRAPRRPRGGADRP